jgi:glycosyltransferase involved in cell wall biosynthesis
LVEPGDIDTLTAALRRLVTEPGRRTAYGHAAAELAAHEHDARRNAERIAEVLRRAAAARARSDRARRTAG